MEEDGETRPHASPVTSRSPDPSSPPKKLTTDPELGLLPSPLSSPVKALALMPLAAVAASGGEGTNRNFRSSGGGGGGRDDCWSEGATAVLIDAWGERFMGLSRGNLKQKHWKEVAEIVNKESSGRSCKTDLQCKNRIDTVKKKYKQEKARIASCGGSSKWVFFEKLDRLIGATANFPNAGGCGGEGESSWKVPTGIPVTSRTNLRQRQAKATPFQQPGVVRRCGESTRWHFRKRSASETESESDTEISGDSADSLPPSPPPLPTKRTKIEKTKNKGGRGLGELARAVLGFVDVYEKAETAKLKQMVEMEKERMKFMKDLELQRMQFLKTQLEMTNKETEEEEEEEEGGGRRRRIRKMGSKNNGNVSS